MNKLGCLPCNEPPEVRVQMTCTCCASSFVSGSVTHQKKNEEQSDNVSDTSVKSTVDRVCTFCCWNCKKIKKRKKRKQSSDSINGCR